MTGDILVVIEHTGEEIDSFALQLIAKGRKLAESAGGELKAILIGDGLEKPTQLLRGSGVDSVLVAESPSLKLYNPELWTRIIESVVKDTKPLLILMGYTLIGMEVGPALATRIGSRLVSNCVDLSLSGDRILVTRPMYGEIVYVQAEVTRERPTVVSVQKGVLPRETAPSRSAAEVVRIEVKQLEADLGTRALDIIEDSKGGDELKRADIIVAVGRGIKDKRNLHLIEELAEALGAAIACSRPLVDNGWLPSKLQVGSCGHVVRPKVYIACGISGAIQHVVGMRDSQRIIAINSDPGAPIFRIARYGVVGDLFQILPSFIERARELSGMRMAQRKPLLVEEAEGVEEQIVKALQELADM